MGRGGSFSPTPHPCTESAAPRDIKPQYTLKKKTPNWSFQPVSAQHTFHLVNGPAPDLHIPSQLLPWLSFLEPVMFGRRYLEAGGRELEEIHSCDVCHLPLEGLQSTDNSMRSLEKGLMVLQGNPT